MPLTKKQFLFLLLITAMPFFVYLARPDLIGADSYYFLQYVCGKQQEIITPPLFYFTLFFIPCNFYAIKLLLFLCCFVCVVFIALMGRLFDKKNGWKAGLLVFLSPLIVTELAKFENDQFAFPFLFASYYFFLKSTTQKNKREKILSQAIAGLLALIACGFWGGGLYVLLLFGLYSILFFFIDWFVIFFFGKRLLSELIGLKGVAETMPLTGINYFFGLLPAFIGWIKAPSVLKFFLLATAMIALVNLKYSILALPFFALCFFFFWNGLNQKIKQIILQASFILAISWGVLLFFLPPTQTQWQAIDYAIQKSNGNTIQNDWGLGYWIEWHNGKPCCKSSPQPFNCQKGLFLTDKNLSSQQTRLALGYTNMANCNLLKSFGKLKIFNCQ